MTTHQLASNISDSLEQQALSQLNAGHFLEAIELYNKLWQQSDDDKWQQQLAFCYLQRALSFANRGMINQALALWDKYTLNSQPPYQAYDHYIYWLIQDDNKNKLRTTLEQLSAEQLDQHYPALAAFLGLLSLSKHPEFQRYLPEDSAFIAHLHLAQTALQAYKENKQDTLQHSLKQIPFRSAFKDLRKLINAAQNPAESAKLLSKIAADSAYAQIARLLLAYTQHGFQLVQALSRCNYQQRSLIAEMKSLNEKQHQAIEQLVELTAHLTAKQKFTLALQFRSLAGEEHTQNFCKAMLVSYPAGHKDFNKNFTALTTFEENRLKALAYEQANNSAEAEIHWLQCIKALKNEADDNELKIALILRHIAEQNPELEAQTQFLIESLNYDPEELTSYLQILHNYSQQDNDRYNLWLQTSLEKFPLNLELLNIAIQAAIEDKKYQLAAQYAQAILTIDALNIYAKQSLFSSHIVQARQFILDQQFQLAEDEITLAENLKLGSRYHAQSQILKGLIYFATEDKKQGIKLITDLFNEQIPGPINILFLSAMETLLTDLPIDFLQEAYSSDQDFLLSRLELEHLIQQIKSYQLQTENLQLLNQALEQIKPAIENSLLQMDYQEKQLLSLSQTFAEVHAFKLLHLCSKQAIKKWDRPIWQYYQLYSENLGMAEMCTQQQLSRLQNIRKDAFQQKSERAMLLIDTFLVQYYQTHSEQSMGLVEDLMGLNKTDDKQDEIITDPIEQIFNQLSEEQQIKLEDSIDELMQEVSVEQLAEDLANDNNSAAELLSAMMQQANLYSALMVIKAANHLDFVINITLKDVLACFNVAQNTPS